MAKAPRILAALVVLFLVIPVYLVAALLADVTKEAGEWLIAFAEGREARRAD